MIREKPRHPVKATRRRRCLMLTEAIVSTIVVGVMLVASLEALRTVVRSRDSQVTDARSAVFASTLMTEILQCAYADRPVDRGATIRIGSIASLVIPAPVTQPPRTFGPETDETSGNRSYFDDLDDYHNWSESPLRDKAGTPLPYSTGWTRTVTVENVDPVLLTATGAVDNGLRRITVTVTSPNNQVTTQVALRSSQSTYDWIPSSQINATTWIGVRMGVGNDAAARIDAGTNCLNY